MIGKCVVLAAVFVVSVLVSSSDVAVAAMSQPVGTSFAVNVIEQIDDKTLRVEVRGASKLSGPLTVRANRATRVEFIGGVLRGPARYGSLGNVPIRNTALDIGVAVGPVLADGSYRLLRLTIMAPR